MLPNTLLTNIKNMTQELHLEKEYQQVVSFLTIFFKPNTKNKYIYPGALSRKLSVDIATTYKILEYLADANSIKRLYEFRCPNDGYKKIFTKNYINLPDHIQCSECEEEFVTRDHLFVIYEVLNER